MRKLKLLLAACTLTGASAVWAQTDVTSTYLKNADFSSSTATTEEKIYGYGHDGSPWGLQDVEEWSKVVVKGDEDDGHPNSGMGGAVIAYGSSTLLQGKGVAAPAKGPEGSSGNSLGFFAVWEMGGYYYQEVTLPAGKYTLTIPIYNQSGTQASTSYCGFFADGDGGVSHTVTVNPTVGSWANQTVTFTLTEQTAGQIRLGYKSTGNGSGANPMIFIDGVKIEYTDLLAGVKADLQEEINKAKALEVASEEQDALSSAISTAEGVLSSGTTEEDFINATEALKIAESIAINKLSAASSSSPSADLLVNGSFDRADQGWTLTNMGYQLNDERPTRYVEKWSGGALSGSGSATQTIKNLPAGYYVLNGTVNAQLQSDKNLEITGVTLSVNGETVSPSGPWKEYEIAYNHQADGDIAVTFAFNSTNANWVSIDGFSLVYVGETYDEALYQDAKLKKDWATANQAAIDALANDNYKNVTGDERTALKTESEKAEPSVGNYKDAIDDLNAAIKAFTDAKASYDALVAANTAVENLADLPYADSSKKPSETGSANTAEGAAATANVIYKALRTYYESNAMAEGVSGAVDMTELIGDPNFVDVKIEDTKAGAWTFDQTGGTVGILNSEPFTDANDNSSHNYFDYYNGNNNNQNVHQEIAELAPGRYLLSVTGRGHTNFSGNLQLYVVGIKDVKIPTIGNSGGIFGRGWNDVSLEFELSTTQTITIGAKTNNNSSGWWSVSRFRLVQLEAVDVPDPADESDYAALSSAISKAESYTLGFENGEYAPYNNVEALQAYAAAKAVNPEAENTKEAVNQVTDALTSAKWTKNNGEVNAIYDGQFANTEANATSGDINLPGWTKVDGIRMLVKNDAVDTGLAYTDGKAAVFSWGGTTLTYGEQAGYTLPMAKHEIYELTLKVSGWRDGDLPNYFSVELDGDKQVESPNTKSINTTDGNPFDELKFFVTPTQDNSILKIYANHHFTIADLSLVKATPISVTVGSEGYATYVTKAPLDFSTTDIKAYTAKVDGNKVVLTRIEKVPANTPVVLYCEGGNPGEIIPFAATTDTPAESDLVAGNGGTVVTDDGNYTNYILNNWQGIGFYRANGQTVAKGRAYLHVANATDSRLSIVFDGEATGISELKDMEAGKAVYNLQGVRVKNAKKGLYIVDGKKVIVK